ncbi:MAG: thioredoxin family protein [Phycisphaerae bacterium]|jgi:thioredoxin 1|nr:thioredoxin family protein [Phycisphaerae bacterium]
MHSRRSLAVLVLTAALTTLGCQSESNPSVPAAPGAVGAAADHPPIFDHRPYAEAKAAAEAEKKWFLVKATAVWCGPCKQMDKTTWRDEQVVAWLKEHAIVVSIDVDQQPEIAKELAIEAMPTMIAFRDGKEFDRIVGMRTPEDFLPWLTGIDKGEKSIDAVTRKAGSRDPSEGTVDIKARLDLARSLAQSGDPVKAADEYAWLWENMLEHMPSMVGVRVSFMANDMGHLASRNAEAKKRFTALRDATIERLREEKVDWQDVGDLLTLNEVVSDPDASLAWFDSVKADPRWKQNFSLNMFRLRPLLVAHDRWADLGLIITNPVRELEQSWNMFNDPNFAPKGVDAAQLASMKSMMIQRLRDGAAHDYASLLAAEREDEAGQLLKRAYELDATEEMARGLIGAALVAKEPRRAQVEFLASIESTHAGLAKLKTEVEAALAGAK